MQKANRKGSAIEASQKVKVKEGRFRYEWPALKQEFFESDYQEAEVFLRSKYGTFNGNMRRHCLGWGVDKRSWRDAEVQMALQNLQSDRVAGLKQTLDKVVTLAKREIDAMGKKGVKVKSLVKLWELIRTESGLPKSINRNINDNNNIDLGAARSSLLDKVNKK